MSVWQQMFATHVMGPVALTKALLPSMRAAGRGRIVLVCSAAGVRGMPATAPYSASKGAMERWGESMAGEIAPFGLGVTILVTGTYDTDIITDAGTIDDRDFDGPYARPPDDDRQAGLRDDATHRPAAGEVRRRPGEGAGRLVAVRRQRSGPMRRCCWSPTDFCRAPECITCRGSCWAFPARRCATAPLR